MALPPDASILQMLLLLRYALEKTLALLALLLGAMVLCGLFGALHDQISYTVSPEYFTRFKFLQFGALAVGPVRLSVAYVGVQATWWMGIPIGATLGTIGLSAQDARTMLRETLRAFGVVAAVSLVFGFGGLLWGMVTFQRASPPIPPGWYLPPGGVQDLAAFLRAGAMHNASYLGGAVGTLVAAVLLARRVTTRRHRPT